MVQRYAYIVDGETLWGPGPQPYFIQLQNNILWEVLAHSVEESEAVGVYEVAQVDYQEEFDTRFYQCNFPEYSIVDGRPQEVYTYTFIPAARDNMISGVDEYAERVRQTVATQYPGQYQEYERVYNEAVEVLSLPEDQEILSGEYPYLEADIGVTILWGSDRPVANVRESALTVKNTRDDWNKLCGAIRKSRLSTKKNLREAASDEEAIQIFYEFCNKKVPDFWLEAIAVSPS